MRSATFAPIHAPAYQQGLSLVELLVVLAVSSTLAAVALPTLGSALLAIQARQTQAELIAAARLAQSEAHRRGHAVVLAPVSACATPSSAPYNWGCGWRVFADANTDRIYNADHGDQLIRDLSAPPHLSIGSSRGDVSYNPNGTTSKVQTISIGGTREVTLSWARIQ